MWALIRLDKIGDLVCTLPVDHLIPVDQKRLWIIYEDLKPLIENRTDITQSKFRTLQRNTNWKQQYQDLQSIFKECQISHIIFYYGPWWVGLAAVQAKINFRFTRYFKPWTYLFFNNGLRQSRSKSEKHELEYNFELTQKALQQVQIKPIDISKTYPILKLEVQTPRRHFEKFSLKHKQYLVIHPSMAGSALNWPQIHWSELISTCLEKYKVIITGSSSDEDFLNQINIDKNHSNLIWTVNQFSFYDLLGILQSAKIVIAPSTGVLHLARALSTNSIGIYPPVLSQHPDRWKAQGANIFLPPVLCPATKKCLLEKCSYHPCMKLITPKEIFQKIQTSMEDI
jgi:heptosyltransferase I